MVVLEGGSSDSLMVWGLAWKGDALIVFTYEAKGLSFCVVCTVERCVSVVPGST